MAHRHKNKKDTPNQNPNPNPNQQQASKTPLPNSLGGLIDASIWDKLLSQTNQNTNKNDKTHKEGLRLQRKAKQSQKATNGTRPSENP